MHGTETAFGAAVFLTDRDTAALSEHAVRKKQNI